MGFKEAGVLSKPFLAYQTVDLLNLGLLAVAKVVLLSEKSGEILDLNVGSPFVIDDSEYRPKAIKLVTVAFLQALD